MLWLRLFSKLKCTSLVLLKKMKLEYLHIHLTIYVHMYINSIQIRIPWIIHIYIYTRLICERKRRSFAPKTEDNVCLILVVHGLGKMRCQNGVRTQKTATARFRFRMVVGKNQSEKALDLHAVSRTSWSWPMCTDALCGGKTYVSHATLIWENNIS